MPRSITALWLLTEGETTTSDFPNKLQRITLEKGLSQIWSLFVPFRLDGSAEPANEILDQAPHDRPLVAQTYSAAVAKGKSCILAYSGVLTLVLDDPYPARCICAGKSELCWKSNTSRTGVQQSRSASMSLKLHISINFPNCYTLW